MNISADSTQLAVASQTGQTSHAQLRNRFYLALFLIDTAAIFGSFLVAHLIYGGAKEEWFVVAAPLYSIYMVMALSVRAYSIVTSERPTLGMTRAAHAFFIAAVLVLVAAFFLKASAEFSRGMVSIGMVLGLMSLMVGRYMLTRHTIKLMGGNPYAVYLICDTSEFIDFSDFACVIHAGPDIDPEQNGPEMYDRLAALLKDADRVIVACPMERRILWAHMLKGANIQAEIMAPQIRSIAPMGLERWKGVPTYVVANGPLSPFDALTKRIFDLTLSGIALLCISPLLAIIAIAIKLETKGPVFFVQTRIGQCNRQFKMLKFRSMRTEQLDHGGKQSTRRDDDRITRVGGFLRKTSLDELPQLINVLLGDMSIVGPRPHALASRAADKLFWEIDDRYWHRHAAKPGLTGLAQIRGFRGATEETSDLTNRLQSDLEYLHNWSLLRDFWIILNTVKVLVHKNAY